MTEIEILQCFRRNANGSWTGVKECQIGGMTMGLGNVFGRNGIVVNGVDVAAFLDRLAAKYPQAVRT
jgi:hypothetical protein